MSTRPRGRLHDWKPTRSRQSGILADLIARYQQHSAEGTLPRGGRGMFYDLRPNGMGNGVTYRKPDAHHPVSKFGPMEAHPAAVQEVLALARRAGIIAEEWVADARAPFPAGRDSWASVEEYARDSLDGFALDLQEGQPVYVEVLCEAEDLISRLARIAGPYGVLVYSGAGFDGLKAKRAFAARSAARSVPTVVLNVGDRDAHGESILQAATEDAQAWLSDLHGMGSDWLEFRRLAVTAEQAAAYDILDADGKAEADARPVPVLDAILTDALDELLVPSIRRLVMVEQSRQRSRLPGAIAELLDAGGRP